MLTQKNPINLKQLYTTDDYQWLLENIELLKGQRFDGVDWENLIEELEDLGSEKRNAVESLLEQVIRHLLLLEYWREEKEYNANYWATEIVGLHNQLKRKLTTNLRKHLAKELESLYQDALRYVKQKTQNKVDFPLECPYTLKQLLDVD